jgi:hypothetical protein
MAEAGVTPRRFAMFFLRSFVAFRRRLDRDRDHIYTVLVCMGMLLEL